MCETASQLTCDWSQWLFLTPFGCLQLLMIGPNQHFGEKALLSADYKFRANAVARGHVTVLCASREDFAMVCNQSS